MGTPPPAPPLASALFHCFCAHFFHFSLFVKFPGNLNSNGCHLKWDEDVGCGDVGLGDAGYGDFGTRRRMGIRGRDKQIAPDFCAELVKYSFSRVKCKII